MKTIKILGTGCPNCKRAEAIVKTAINELNLDIKIEKVEDIQEIMKYNIMSTPAIALDEVVLIKGRVPSLAEVKDLLTSNTCCNTKNDDCCGNDNRSDTCFENEDDFKNSSCCQPDSKSC